MRDARSTARRCWTRVLSLIHMPGDISFCGLRKFGKG
jgi:hypothetical protein